MGSTMRRSIFCFFMGLALALLVAPAFATGKKPPPEAVAKQGQLQGQAQGQAQIAKGGSGGHQAQIAKGGDQSQTAYGGHQAQKATGGAGYGGEQSQTAAGGDQQQNAEGGDSQNSVNTSSETNTRYKIPPAAIAGIATSQANADCHGVMGIDVRGAGNDAAGGTSIGVPKTNSKCQRDKYIAESYLSEDYKTYWQLKCSVPEVWKGRRDAVRAMTGEKLGKWEAIRACIEDAKEPYIPKAEAEKVTAIAVAEEALQCDEKVSRCEAVVVK